MDLLDVALPIFTAKKTEKKKEFQIPIQRILDIPVSMYIKFAEWNKDEPYNVEIYPRSAFIDEHSTQLVHNLYYKTLKDALKSVDSILENPLWSPFCSSFVLEEKHTKTQHAAFFEKYKNNDKIKLPANECCVCNDVVQSETSCGHRLCLRCHIRIEEEADKKRTQEQKNGDEEYNINCPMCRQEYTLTLH